MWLNEVWYVLFVLIISGYLILDGFDLGVGILHLFLARNDTERRIMLNSIGPVWDGNEVWLVVGGGVLFAAFPLVYASLFSGFYIAMMLVLLFFILRTAAIEFRSKRESQGWRSLWDSIFFLSSLAIAFLLGVAFGNIISGIPLDARGNIDTSLISLLTPFALLVGLTTVFMLAMHGAIYITIKTDGELLARAERWLLPFVVIFFVLNTLIVLTTAMSKPHISDRYFDQFWPVVFPALALASVLVAWWMVRRGRYFVAFVASSIMIAMLLIAVAVGLFPDLLVSTIDPAYDLTIYNAASGSNTLAVMLIMAFIGIPFVLAYTAGVYYIFRGKVRLGPGSY
jgi:cytochrome d ubiquinol oxidase subunit II